MTNRFVTFDLRCRNLVTATHTRVLPISVVKMSRERKHPVRTRLDESRSGVSCLPSRTVEKFASIVFSALLIKREKGGGWGGCQQSPHHIPSPGAAAPLSGALDGRRRWRRTELSRHQLSHWLGSPQASCHNHHFHASTAINFSQNLPSEILVPKMSSSQNPATDEPTVDILVCRAGRISQLFFAFVLQVSSSFMNFPETNKKKTTNSSRKVLHFSSIYGMLHLQSLGQKFHSMLLLSFWVKRGFANH